MQFGNVPMITRLKEARKEGRTVRAEHWTCKHQHPVYSIRQHALGLLPAVGGDCPCCISLHLQQNWL